MFHGEKVQGSKFIVQGLELMVYSSGFLSSKFEVDGSAAKRSPAKET
jgi:hypothetical protein